MSTILSGKGYACTNTEALEWIWYNKMDDILVGTAKVDGIPQGMDMGKILEHKLILKRLMVTPILTLIQHHQLFKFQFCELKRTPPHLDLQPMHIKELEVHRTKSLKLLLKDQSIE